MNRRPKTPAGDRSLTRKGHASRIALLQERAIAALISESTVPRAARRLGVHERTLRRWLHDTEFCQALSAARQSAFRTAMDRIDSATGRAVETLEALLGEKRSPSVRLGAARTLLELAIHSHDRTEILQKLDRLEELQRKSE